jgi:hypothetical protein
MMWLQVVQVECSCNWRDRQTIEDGCGNAMDQTHASNHPATGTANNQGSQSRRQKKEDRAMTAQHSRAAHNTHSTRGGGWCWLTRTDPLTPPPANHAPTSPQNGRGRGPRSYQPSYQDVLSDRTVPQYRVSLVLYCTPPKRQRQRE